MKLRIILSQLSYYFHVISLNIKVPNSNKFKKSNSVLMWKSKIKCKGKNNLIEIGNNVNLKNTTLIIEGNNNHITIGENVKIYEFCKILIEGTNCKIFIGDRTTIGSGNIFCGESNTKIKIGSDCMISRNVSMNTSDFHSIIDIASKKRINIPQDINIGNSVWLGYNSRINKGAFIDEQSVIAIGAIVPGKSFPKNVIIAGVPAKIIKENITWSREKLLY